MWMVGYNEGGEFNMPDHAFNGRRLRPLVPRPLTSPISTDFFSQYHNLGKLLLPFLSLSLTLSFNSASCFSLGISTKGKKSLFLASVGEQEKREFNTNPPVVVSTRWNPTPEQLRALEELYRRGTRTPSAEQIQHITAQLRRFGKIEGKNVFYWFQNHKARERQKRRRQVESAAADQGHPTCDLDALEKKDSGKTLKPTY